MAIAAAPWCRARRAWAASSATPSSVVFRLDLQRFTEPSAIALTLRRDGRLSDLRYVPARLLVTSAQRRDLPAGEVQRWQARAREPALVDAMRGGPFGRAGLAQGDQFRLWAGEQGPSAAPGRSEAADAPPRGAASASERGGQPLRMAHGFVDDAPPAIRTLIADLLAAAERPARGSTLAAAYIRAEPLGAEREASLRHAGRVRFVALSELDPGARARAAAAVGDPFEFHALTRDQYERLLAHRAHGAELFVAPEGRTPASQLVLFSTR